MLPFLKTHKRFEEILPHPQANTVKYKMLRWMSLQEVSLDAVGGRAAVWGLPPPHGLGQEHLQGGGKRVKMAATAGCLMHGTH